MTLKEIELNTPNGLHDSYLLSYAVDHEARTLKIQLSWLVGRPDGETEEEREGYRRGSLLIRNLQYLVVEAPDNAGNTDEPSSIEGFETRQEDIDRCQLPALSNDMFRHSLFFFNWNSFIHFAGASAEVEPLDLLGDKGATWR